MSPLNRTLLLAFSAIGLAASTYSSFVHYRLLTQPGFTSFCDVSATVNCTEAYLSQYGSFLGVPVALGGVLYFALTLLLTAIAGRATSPARDSVPAYIFALSTPALAFILYLAWASYFRLQTFCILCAITYVSVMAIFIVSGGATSFPMTTLPGRARRDARTLVSSPVALIVTLLFVAGAVTVIAAFPRESPAPLAQQQAQASYPPVTDQQRADLERWWDMQPKSDLPIPKGDAKVLVVKFNDYQCGACRVTYDAYKPLLEKYSASGLKYVTKHFPLEPECNSNVPTGNHYAACEAAAAVEMARPKGNADKMEHWIFSNIGPPMLTPDQVKKAAADVAGITDFDAQYAKALQQVKTDASLGGLLGVSQTPTFYINGRKVPEILQPQYFEVLIQLELKRGN